MNERLTIVASDYLLFSVRVIPFKSIGIGTDSVNQDLIQCSGTHKELCWQKELLEDRFLKCNRSLEPKRIISSFKAESVLNLMKTLLSVCTPRIWLFVKSDNSLILRKCDWKNNTFLFENKRFANEVVKLFAVTTFFIALNFCKLESRQM